VATPSLNELLKQLLEKEGHTAPSGWFTSKQLLTEWGLKERHASKLLNRMVKAGLVQRKKFIANFGTRSQMVWHYAKTGV
jgi:DNA-binding MarR family transcriptional regulator